jgi:hypothetical protein
MKKILFILMLVLTLISCTENSRARHWGGTENISLPENRIFVNATWKETSLWILSKDTIDNKYYFNEKSSFGLIEGTIIIK